MNKRYTLLLRAGILALLFSGIFTVTRAQLKVGDNPGTINKSSVLELESTRQGLLLTRITDTSLAPLPSAPNGMIIFLTTDQSLRVRSNGAWVRLSSVAEAAANWSLKGNALTDPAVNYLGTSDAQGLSIRTNATEAIHVNTDQTLLFKSVPFDTLVQALVINPATGAVSKRTLSSAAFGDAIRSLNGLTSKGITIKADTANANFGITANAADSTITYNIPIVGDASKRTGLLTYADWLTFSAKQQAITIGAFAATASATGLTLANGVLTLTPADAANPGAVSAVAQTFAGPKTFADNLTATSNASVGGNLSVTGASTLTGATTVGNTLTVTGATTVNNTLHATGAATLDGALNLTTAPPDAATAENTVLIRNTTSGAVEKKILNPAAFEGAIQQIDGQKGPILSLQTGATGTDVNVDSTTTANHIFINIPDAATGARGVVTTGAQAFAGSKTFRDTVSVGASAVIGTLAANTNPAPNSTLQLNGSISMAIRTITASATLTATDNTVLVDTNGGAATVTLPAATNIIGRVYTIKKIAGGIDKQLTIAPTGGTIEGASSYIIYNDYTYVTVQTDGANWYVIRK